MDVATTAATLGKHDGPNLESSSSGIHWAAIFGGAAAAAAISLILIPLGSAFGFSSFSVFSATGANAIAFTAGWAIWLVVMQWVSSGIGGYLAGRLRVKWADLHSDEVFFRDTAHGLLAWAVATLLTVGLVAGMTMSAAGAGAQAASAAVDGNDRLAYYADGLYRGAAAPTSDVSTETTRILATDLANGGVTTDDKAYLAHLVAARTGTSPDDAYARVNRMVAQIDAAKQQAAAVAEKARKAAVGFSTILFLSLLIGAFIACVSAALGGRLRDSY